MFNLVKYELKGYYKDFIIILGVIAALNALLYTRINTWPEGSIFAFSLLISFAAAVVVFIWNIRLFSRDLYEDSGYLLFTIPQSGYSILGAKLTTSIIQGLIVGAVALIFNYISIRENVNLNGNFSMIMRNISPKFIGESIISSLFEYIFFLTTIYFSIALSKVAIKKKRVGKLGAFIIFIVVSIIVTKITDIVINIFPQTFNLNIMAAKSAIYTSNAIPINIAAVILNIMLFILMFMATSYILQNKIDF